MHHYSIFTSSTPSHQEGARVTSAETPATYNQLTRLDNLRVKSGQIEKTLKQGYNTTATRENDKIF